MILDKRDLAMQQLMNNIVNNISPNAKAIINSQNQAYMVGEFSWGRPKEKSPFEIAAEIRARNPLMQVKRITL